MGIAFSPALTSQEQALEHPHALAATAELRGGLERRRAEIHSLRRHARSPPARRRRYQTQFVDPDAGSRDRRALPPPAYVDRLRAGEVRLGRRRRLRLLERPVDLHRRDRADARRHLWNVAAGTYRFRSADEGKPVVDHLHLCATGQLRPEPDASLRADRSRFHRREGQQGSGPGRAGRHRSRCRPSSASSVSRATTNMRSTPVEARDQSADRDLRPARRLDDPGARDLRRVRHRPDRRADDPAARALCPHQVHVQAVVGILPARSDGRRDDHRRQSRAVATIRCASSRSRRTTRGCSPSRRRSSCSASRRRPSIQTQRRGGVRAEQGAPAVPVNTPLIYEPPPSLTGGVAQVWVGASGGRTAVRRSQWGGANV